MDELEKDGEKYKKIYIMQDIQSECERGLRDKSERKELKNTSNRKKGLDFREREKDKDGER